MYQVITEVTVDGRREMDSVFPKIYVRKGAAERNAKGGSRTGITSDGKTITTKCYVRGVLHPETEQEAKAAYCHSRNVWVDCQYGHVIHRLGYDVEL